MTSIRSCSSLYGYSQAILCCKLVSACMRWRYCTATCTAAAVLDMSSAGPLLYSATARMAVCSQDHVCLGLTCFNAVGCRPMAPQRWRRFRSEEKWRGSFGGCPGILHLCPAPIGQVSARATFQASSRTFVLARSPHHAICCSTHPHAYRLTRNFTAIPPPRPHRTPPPSHKASRPRSSQPPREQKTWNLRRNGHVRQ